MDVVAIIPARGGSKGIPRKNLLRVGGKPLLAHSILQAKEAPAVTRVVVSTDDEEIAMISRQFGADVVPRPVDISGDKASSESALLHALDWLRSHPGTSISHLPSPNSEQQLESSRLSTQESPLAPDPDLVVFLQATSPCRAPGEVQRAIDTFIRAGADSLLSVGPVHGFVWRVEKDGSTRSFSYDHLNRPRRQDAPEDLIENGSIYIFKPWVLRQFNNRLGGKVTLHRMPSLDSFQIDEPGDFELLELIMRHRGVIEEEEAQKRTQKAEIESIRPLTPGHQTQASGQARPLADLQLGTPAAPPDSQLSTFGSQLGSIRLLALDFDGVLTDNRVLVSQDGSESVLCSREDGLGLEMLRKQGRVEVVVISKEKNPVVTARCQKLRIDCIQSCDNKLLSLSSLASNRHLTSAEVAYVGNDVNDLECLRWAGLPIAVGDAMPEAKAVAKWITGKLGGRGAIRQVCDGLMAAHSAPE